MVVSVYHTGTRNALSSCKSSHAGTHALMARIQHYATYPLAADGTIQNWLACGTVTSPLTHLDTVINPDGSPFGNSGRWVLNYWAWDERSKSIKKRLYEKLPPFTWKPGILPVLHAPAID